MKIEYKGKDIYLIPKEGHTQVLIFMHGLGDSPESFVSDFTNAVKPVPAKTKVILLAAPIVRIEMYGNEEMSSWFDLSLIRDNDNSKGMTDVHQVFERVSKIIEEEASGLNGKYNKIFIGGFSQGACLSFHIGYTFKHLLGGIMPLSGVLFPQTIKGTNMKDKEDLPCFIGFGTQDNVINYTQAKASFASILNNKKVELHTYSMAHTIRGEEYDDMKVFMEKCLLNE